MQTDGWKQGTLFTSDTLEKLDDVVYDKPTSYAGTMGRSLRMEALEINFKAENATLKYRAHVQTDGWQEWVTADSVSDHKGYVGTVGASRRMEAVQISVEGLEGYKLLYRAHVQGEGWQDWVDAEDSDSFAGTTGKSKRIEALEIAVVSEDGFEYVRNEDGTHTLKYNNEEVKTEKCTYGEMTTTDGKNVDKTCSSCGYKETKTIEEVLKDESVTELEVQKLDTTDVAELVVPVGKTLTVDEAITGNKSVTVDGSLVLKKSQSNLKLKGTGTVIWAPEATSVDEFNRNCGKLTQNLKASGGKLSQDATEDAKNLKYEIRVPELSEPQTITEQDNDALTIGKGWNVTLDLGTNTLITSSANTSNNLIINKGNLTIKNGTVKTVDNNTKFVLKSTEKDAKLNLEDVVVSGAEGISSNGNLTIKGGKVESTKNADNQPAIYIYGETAKTTKATLTDVEVVTKNIGIFLNNENHDLVIDGGKINVTGTSGTDYALASYSGDSSISLDGTEITSEEIGIYIQNGGGSSEKDDHGTLVTLNNVTLTSKEQSLWAGGLGDRFVVTGGSYRSHSDNAVYIFSGSCGLSTFEGCTLSGWPEAVKLVGNAKEGPDGNLVLTNVTKTNEKV